MNPDSIYIFNPKYKLKKDKNRVIIANRSSDPLEDSFMGFVHPMYSIIFSLFEGTKTLNRVIEDLSQLTGNSAQEMTKTIHPLLENKSKLHFKYDGRYFSLPENVLVPVETVKKPITYNPADFLISKDQLDLDTSRLYSPLDLLFMVNNRCVTDCIYCYADRLQKIPSPISFRRIKELISEARALEMRAFDITGGELFLYEHWEELLTELIGNDFHPYISTKFPIDAKIISKLQDLGIKNIQISIDSIVKEELMELLNVKEDYHRRIINTFELLDKSNLEVYTNSQLTNVNIGSLEKLFDFLIHLRNIKSIRVGVAGASLYKSIDAFQTRRPKLADVKKAEAFINDMKEKYRESVSVNFSGYTDGESILNKNTQEKKEGFNERAQCSGNINSLILLPDGKVTICEELYWHPAFIIGDLTKQSISDVWNSTKALDLYNLPQESISTHSQCRTCDEFEPCHKIRGVCWKEVLYAYGNENWDFPDPKCPLAPEPHREYYFV